MKKISVIDLGSNSARLTVAAVENGSFSVVSNVSSYVRLSEGLTDDSNTLKPEPVLRTVSVLKRFAEQSALMGAEKIYLLATEAVRRADNREWFCDAVKELAGLEVIVLSGEEEVGYDCISISENTGIDSFVMIDTGGGSTEIALYDKGLVKRFVSMPWGAVTLTTMFSETGDFNEDEFHRAMCYIADGLSSVAWLDECIGYPVVGVGGSLRVYNRLSSDMTLPVYLSGLVGMSVEERISSGVPGDRADIIPAGLLPAHMLLLALGIDDIIVSSANIRDGFLHSVVLNI